MAHDDPAETPIPARLRSRRRGTWTVRLEGEEHEATDLSAGGLFVREVTRFAPGTRLELELALSEAPLTTQAVVRWIREVRVTHVQPEGMGLAFEELSDEDRARILAEVERPDEGETP